jgi:hypothetical protein
VEQHVDAAAALADVVHDGGDGVGVGEIHRVVVRGAPAGLDRLDGGERGVEPFVPGEFALDRHRGGPVARGLDPLGDRGLQPVAVLAERGEVGIHRIRGRREIEEMERAAGRRGEVGGDRRDDAAGGPGDEHDRLGVERHARRCASASSPRRRAPGRGTAAR